MSSDIYAKPDLSKKVRYNRNVEERKEEWQEAEVDIYESADDIGNDCNHFQSHEGGPHREECPAPIHRRPWFAAVVCLGVLCFLMLTAIVILSKQFSLENEKLQTRYDKLSNNYTQLQETASEIEVKIHQLQNSNETLSKDLRQLQDEVKQLQGQIEGKWCPEGWKRFGCSCYFRSREKKWWYGSRSDCQSKGADLVVINNKEEHEFVRQLSENEESWIGLQTDAGTWVGNRRVYEWKWVDGAPLTDMLLASGLPQTTQQAQNSACCDGSGQWTQSEYYHNKYWICEK